MDSFFSKGDLYFSSPISGTVSDIKFTLVSPDSPKDNLKPVKVIFNGMVTICFWKDGSKIVVRCVEEDIYDRDTAVAMCIAHKVFGSHSDLKKFVKQGYVQVEK